MMHWFHGQQTANPYTTDAPDFFILVSSTLLLKPIFSGLKRMLILLVKVLKK